MTVAGGEKELHSRELRDMEGEMWRGKERGLYEEVLYTACKETNALCW